jgi:hypothetical protein
VRQHNPCQSAALALATGSALLLSPSLRRFRESENTPTNESKRSGGIESHRKRETHRALFFLDDFISRAVAANHNLLPSPTLHPIESHVDSERGREYYQDDVSRHSLCRTVLFGQTGGRIWLGHEA